LQAGYQKFHDAFSASNGASVGTLNVTANDTSAYMLGFKYATGPWTMRLGYEREQFTNPSHPSADAITSLFGFPISGAVNVKAFDTRKTLDVYWGGVNYDLTSAWTLSAAYYQVNQNDFSGTGCATASAKCSGDSKFYSLLADYRLSKRSDVYVGMMANRVSGGLGYGYAHESNLIFGTGVRHSF
ncbi:MAG: porin, partial [Betaproteobacteria bacterium]|nr:porin [Betaproteobacteria bacterium]